MATHKDDIVRALVDRRWTKGAGGDLYFPSSHPHLHARIKSGFNTFTSMTQWLDFLVLSKGSRGRSTELVRSGREVAGGISGLPEGNMKTEASYVCRQMRVP